MIWFEQTWLLLLVDVSVKSLVLALIAWAALATLRVRNANIRHRVWSAVLVGMMALPLLVPATPTVPLPVWLTPEFSSASEPIEIANPSQEEIAAHDIDAPDPNFPIAFGNQPNTASSGTMAAKDTRLVSEAIDFETASSVQEVGRAVAVPTLWSRANLWLAAHWSTAILEIYVAVAVGFLLRIFLGMLGTRRIVARSIPCASSWKTTRPNPLVAQATESDTQPRGLAKVCTSAIPVTLQSDELRVPLTVGFLRPKILLPANWRGWSQTKLEAVLAHETEHIRRGDYFITLLAELNRAIHWLNPLSWMLRRWLSELAEQNCDDAVIASTGERTQYARYLLEVASSLDTKGRVAWSGVAMARKPNVETRIDAILDSNRPLARRLGVAGAVVLIATAIPAILLAAALRPVDDTPAHSEVTAAPIPIEESAPVQESKAGEQWLPLGANPTPLDVSSVPSSTEPVHIRGQVVGPDGAGVKAMVHLVSAFSGGLIRPGREKVLDQFETDELGFFDVQRHLPPRDDSVDMGGMPGARVEQIVARATGFGPAVSDVIGIREGKAVTLTLPADNVHVEGRILNLEGEPVKGATLRVALLGSVRDSELDKTLDGLRVRAGEKPQGMMLSGTFTPAFGMTQRDEHLNERIAGNKLSYSRLSPSPVKTDNRGRFTLTGIGRDRLIALELSGPGIVTSWLSVVTRDMKPIGKTAYIGNRTDMTYGAKFVFSAEPEQIIEGVVTDMDSGAPVGGVTIESAQELAGLSSSITDAEGRYRLTGLPKSNRHTLHLRTPNGSPYFSRKYIEVKEFADGLQPTKLDFPLKKTAWITGTVIDKVTGMPVKGRVVFSPHTSNKSAEAYSLRDGMYIDPIRLDFGADTDDSGHFRVRAVPGEGVLAVRCKDNGFCTGHGVESLDKKWLIPGSQRVTNTFHRILPDWMHGFQVVKASAEKTVSAEITVDSGNTLTVKLVDPQDKPLDGVFIRGRVPQAWNEPRLKTSTVNIEAVRSSQPRAVLFLHQARNLGAYLLANQADRSSEQTIKLHRCGILKGRLLGKDGKPLAGTPIAMSPLSFTDRESAIPLAETDKDGKFELKQFTPLATFRIHTLWGPEQEVIAASIELEPGETRDLGDVRLEKTIPRPQNGIGLNVKPNDQDDEKQADANAPDSPRSSTVITSSDSKVVIASSGESSFTVNGITLNGDTKPAFENRNASSNDTPLIYAGQVRLPNGNPAAGAEIYLNYWKNTPLREIPAKPVAITDERGRFRFERDFAKTDIESIGAHVVAKLNGYGFATAFSPALEESGQVEAKLREHEGYAKQIQPMLDRDRGPMRLSSDDAIIRGKIVDLEGNGIAGVKVAVVEVLANVDGTSATWDDAIKNPSIDYITISNLFLRQIRGPEVASMIGSVLTDDTGRFRIQGLGKHRIAKLAITGRNIEATSVFARTDRGKTVALPMQSGGFGGRTFQYHGNEFIHVANASRPVVGRVTDTETGKPIAGAIINSTVTWSQTLNGNKATVTQAGSDVAYAITDANGEYRLDGLPRVAGSLIRAIGLGTEFLAKSTNVDTSGNGIDPVTLDFQLDRGMVIEGRVTDATNGQGVQGMIEFVPKGSRGRMVSMMGAEGPKLSDSEGRFKLVVARKDGHVCFTALRRHLYQRKSLKDSAESGGAAAEEGAIGAFRGASEFHAVHSVRVDHDSSRSFEWKLARARTITGQAIAPNGQRVTDLKYVGEAGGIPHWSDCVSGNLKIHGLKTNQMRRIAVICEKQELAGVLELSGASDGFTVKLQKWATLKGRLVGEDGEPLAGAQLMRGSVFGQPLAIGGGELPVNVEAYHQALPLPPVQVGRMTNYRHSVDSEGRFEIKGLVPGHAYAIGALYQGGPTKSFSNDIVKQLVLKPGETRDLQTIVLKKPTREQLEQSIRSSPKPVALTP